MQTIRSFCLVHPRVAERSTLAILMFPLFMSGTLLIAADAPPAKSWADLMAERARFRNQFRELVGVRKTGEAMEVVQKIIALDRNLLTMPVSNESEKKAAPILRGEIVGGLKWLVNAHLHAEAWSAAAKGQGEIADFLDANLGNNHYRAIDARNDQIYFQRLASLKPEDVPALLKADEAVAEISGVLAQGKYSEAIPLAKEAVKVQQQLLGNSSPRLALSLNNLAKLYCTNGNLAAAESLLRQAGEITRLGHHPEHAATLTNEAALSIAHGGYDRSYVEQNYFQALDITKEAVGENHPDYAARLSNLAMFYYHEGDYAARALYLSSGDHEKGVRREPPQLRPMPNEYGHALPSRKATTRRPSRFIAEPWRSETRLLGRTIPITPPASVISRIFTTQKATLRGRSRFAADLWRSGRRCSARITLNMPKA